MSYELGRISRRRQRHARRHTEPTYTSGLVGAEGWSRLTDAEHLLAIFFEMRSTQGQGAGCDGFSYDDFSTTEIAGVLRCVSRAIAAGTYVPYPERLCRIPKASGGTRELRLGTIVDRVVATALARECRGPLERLLVPSSYGNRRRCSRFDALARLVWEVNAGRHVLLEEDIQGAFDNVVIACLFELLPRLIYDSRVCALIQRILLANRATTIAEVRRLYPVGIPQGSALSPLLLELLLTVHLDGPLQAARPSTPVLRYCDNLAAAVGTVSEGRELREQIVRHLATIGMRLKASSGPLDLRRQGAHRFFLGFDVHLNTATERRLAFKVSERGWEQLRTALEETCGSANPIRLAKQVVESWIRAQGPACEEAEAIDRTLLRVRREAERLGLGSRVVTEGLEGTASLALSQWRDLLSSQQQVQGTIQASA